MASMAIPAASLPYPFSYNSTVDLPLLSDGYRLLSLRTWVLSCSTAPALKVSHAAISTRHLFSTSQKHILARLVLFPTPFTPQNVITYGLLFAFASRTSRMISTRRLGVNMSIKDVFIDSLTMPCTDWNVPQIFPSSLFVTESHMFLATSAATFLA